MHDICSTRIKFALQKVSEDGKLIKDRRGQNPNPRAIPAEIVGYILEQIQQLPFCFSPCTYDNDPNIKDVEVRPTMQELFEKYLC